MTFPRPRTYHCFEVRGDGSFVKPVLREEDVPVVFEADGEIIRRLFDGLDPQAADSGAACMQT